MKALRYALAYLVARAHEASSIVSVSGAGGVLAAYFSHQVSGRVAMIGVVAALLGYLMPQDKSVIDAVAGAIRGPMPAFAAITVSLLLMSCSTPLKPLPPLDAQSMFKQGCAAVSTANGAFVAVSPALLVAGNLTPQQVDQEKAIFTIDSNRCDHPPTKPQLDAAGKPVLDPAGQPVMVIDYQAAAVDAAADAAAIYLMLAVKH